MIKFELIKILNLIKSLFFKKNERIIHGLGENILNLLEDIYPDYIKVYYKS